MAKERVAAVIVTYNRKALLMECLDGVLSQERPPEAIFIIDNASSDGTPAALRERGLTGRLPEDAARPAEESGVIMSNGVSVAVSYVRLPENTGGAGGFHEGVKRAYLQGYDWLWLMDDDAVPNADVLKKLLSCEAGTDIAALACAVRDASGKIQENHRGLFNLEDIYPRIQTPLALKSYEQNSIIEIEAASFVGLLLSRNTVKQIGYPNRDFFLHHDDMEYCLRMGALGKILLLPQCVMVHKEMAAEPELRRFLGRSYAVVPYERMARQYYENRNLVWLGRRYASNKARFYLKATMRYAAYIAAICLFNDHKLKRMRFITAAYLDGLTDTWDNDKPARILYGIKD